MQFLKHHLISYFCIVLAAVTAAVLGAEFYLAVPSMVSSADPSPVIVIDAGHGGEDGGAAVSGIREADLNLQIAGRVHTLLCLLGQNSVMLRTEDRSLHSEEAVTLTQKKASDLRNRAEAVNSLYRPVLISIHQNMFAETKYHGAQIFYAPTDRSEEFAQDMQELLRIKLDTENHRQCKPAESVYLMNHVNCPAILIECGFMSNQEERNKLCSAEYQKQLSLVISAGSLDYLRKVITDEV